MGDLQLGETKKAPNRCFAEKAFSSFHSLNFTITSVVIQRNLELNKLSWSRRHMLLFKKLTFAKCSLNNFWLKNVLLILLYVVNT